MRIPRITFLILLFFLLFVKHSYAQLSTGGEPYGFKSEFSRQSINAVNIDPPDYNKLRTEDDSTSATGAPERMGVTRKVSISPVNSGSFVDISSTERMWRINIKVNGAVGLGLYFKDFHLAPGDRLFIYSEDKSNFIGAFTEKNNRANGLFATQPVKGESIIVELIDNKLNNEQSEFAISEVLIVYTPMEFLNNGISTDTGLKSTRTADSCEVNINCIEGDGWRNEANGVVRIQIKNGSTAYWCTGSVMNSTALDFSPLVLTADHCALSIERYATPTDVAQWIFYFKYESKSCTDNTPVAPRSLTGAVKLASSSPNKTDGSDFYLVELDDQIPNSYDPYFEGWSATGDLSNSGVTIHHPAGDVKKISTYTTPLELSQWGTTPETHLMVNWSGTTNGHGVTEGGSSGAPLFNSEKKIIGQLTGGESDCTSLNTPDQFGRVFYSWDKNGVDDSVRLKPWLDPINTGLLSMDGTYNTKVSIARFIANETTIPVGSFVNFNESSTNNPQSWKWIFNGGTPAESQSKDPGAVFYNTLGTYDVILIVSNEFGFDSLFLENYIKVVPAIYPNPTSGNVNVLFGNGTEDHNITVINSLGRKVDDFIVPASQSIIQFSLERYLAGLYLFTVKTGNKVEHYKILYNPL